MLEGKCRVTELHRWCDSLKKNTCIVSHKSDSHHSKERSVLSWISPFLLQTFFFLFQVWKKKNRGVVDKSVFSSLSRNIISYLWLFSVGCVWKLVLKVTTKDQTFISRKLAVSMYICQIKDRTEEVWTYLSDGPASLPLQVRHQQHFEVAVWFIVICILLHLYPNAAMLWNLLQSCIKVRESICLRVSHGEKIAHLALVLACYELKRNATAERRSHPSRGQLPAVWTTAPEMEEVGFCTKSTAMLLPMSWGESWKTCQNSCVTQTCVCDAFLERWAKKASWHEPEINPMNCSLAGVNTPLSVSPSPGWWVTRARAATEFLKSFTEELLQDSALSGGPSLSAAVQLILWLFGLSSCWNFPTCNLRGQLFLSVCGRQRNHSLGAPNMEQELQNVYSFLDDH